MNMNSRGMTLIEAVVWISIFALIMLSLSQMILHFYRVSSYTLQEASAISSAQHGIDLMVRQIREASYSSSGGYPIVSISTSSIVFYAEIDGDPGVERVHYYVSGLNLYQGVTQPVGDPPSYGISEATTTVSDYVHNLDQNLPVFSYYDTNGAQITDYTKIGDVRFVSTSLAIDVDPFRTPTILTLKSSAALRNLIGH